jgi:hypothetical protein
LLEGEVGQAENPGCPVPVFRAGQPIPTIALWQAEMLILILCAALVFVALTGVAYFFYYRLTKTKEDLFAARRQLAHSQARYEGAKKAAQAAEARCVQALGNLEMSLTQAGRALDIAGHIEVVSQQIHGLIEYIAHPLDAPSPAGRKSGRHALPGGTDWPAITGGAQEKQEEFIP